MGYPRNGAPRLEFPAAQSSVTKMDSRLPSPTARLIWPWPVTSSASRMLPGPSRRTLLAYINVKQYGSHPAYPSGWHWDALVRRTEEINPSKQRSMAEIYVNRSAAETLLTRALDWGLQHSNVAASIVDLRLHRFEQAAFDAYARFVDARGDGKARADVVGPPYARSDEARIEDLVQIWARSSVLLDEACRAAGIAYVHVLQPTLFDSGSKPLTQEELDVARKQKPWLVDPWTRSVPAGYEMLRRAGEDLRDQKIRFHDATRLFAAVDETLYYDFLHFSTAGRVMVAEYMAEALRAGDLGLARTASTGVHPNPVTR